MMRAEEAEKKVQELRSDVSVLFLIIVIVLFYLIVVS